MTDQRDPWANRSDGLRCRTCIWFARKGNGDVGRCRRHSPSIGGYPVVFESDWCGDHRLNEEVRAIKIKERQAAPTADICADDAVWTISSITAHSIVINGRPFRLVPEDFRFVP